MLILQKHHVTGAMVLVAAIIILAPFYNTFGALFAVWSNEVKPYDHGYIILVMNAYLLTQGAINWQLKPALQVKKFEQALCVILALLGVFIWLIGSITYLDLLTFIALPIIFCASLLFVFNRCILVQLVSVSALYALSIPLWELFVPLLQALTVFFAGGAAKLSGVSAFIDDIYVHLASGILVVEGGCAGLNYFLSGAALSFMGAQLRYFRLLSTMTAVFIGVVVAMAANWVRVYILIIVADVSAMQHYLIAESHSVFGWCVFGVFFVPYLVFMMRFQGWGMRAVVLPSDQSGPSSSQLRVVALKLATLFGAFVAIRIIYSVLISGGVVPNIGAVKLPSSIVKSAPHISLGLDNPDDSNHWTYISSDSSYFVDYYGYTSKQRDEVLLGYFNQPFKGPKYRAVDTLQLTKNVSMSLGVLTHGGDSYGVLWGYKLGGSIAADRLSGSLLRLQALQFPQQGSGLLVIYKECAEPCEQTLTSDFRSQQSELSKLAMYFLPYDK